MKYIKILFFAIIVISCKNNNPNEFSLDVKVNGGYKGYLYLNYNEKKDSCIISNGRAFFTGTVSYPISASYSTNYISANEKNFYIENAKIKSEITISKKQIKEYNIDWITINKIYGTKTSVIEKDFEDFKLNFSSDKDWQNKLYKKLQIIIELYPKHMYSGNLLSEVSNDTILSKEQIGELYNKLNIEFQDPHSIKFIKSKAFPEHKIKVGNTIYDFSLPNNENKLISTKDFRGQILFIDFWASWCKPCRLQFPELAKINNDFRDNGVIILGVSIDEKENDWLKAIETEKPKWENVIDTGGFLGKLANKYGIFEIPHNVLVDEKGKVIATDIGLEQLRTALDSLIIKKITTANN
ncbi:redoxin domain-containing protein [Mariniflexile sp. HMF6888]|uniref:redoxin domain-containing protein n=1 Tax=Mariniflexile sp. HMF6888 TaxID=3373086 RepID=UPI00378D98C0